ncbi:MAG: aminopeptidase, partial [Firmicutes bacterium]|nr:aminopeptidase [Bacillota bacterium]
GAVSDPAFTYNDSAIHVDFMIGTPDMEIDGETADGTRIPVFWAGDFCCPEFQG